MPLRPSSRCPACQRDNASGASHCTACGAALRWPCPSPAADPPPDDSAPQDARNAAKAARRAEVRRARLAEARSSPGVESPRLLILDESEGARSELAQLLEGFGFLVDPACGIAQACALLDSRFFAAALLNIALDHTHHSAEAALCQRVRSATASSDGRSPALIVFADPARSIERVRAELAGADAVLSKPLARGKLVRALEDCGIALPLDPRRA